MHMGTSFLPHQYVEAREHLANRTGCCALQEEAIYREGPQRQRRGVSLSHLGQGQLSAHRPSPLWWIGTARTTDGTGAGAGATTAAAATGVRAALAAAAAGVRSNPAAAAGLQRSATTSAAGVHPTPAAAATGLQRSSTTSAAAAAAATVAASSWRCRWGDATASSRGVWRLGGPAWPSAGDPLPAVQSMTSGSWHSLKV
jgi:hypothetical protein